MPDKLNLATSNPPTPMRKPRPDSTIHNLPEELRQAVDDALAANATLKDVQAILAEGGVRLSLQSISEYYKLHLLPRIWAAEDHNAAQLAKIKRGNVTKATHAAVLQTCYEVITRPGKKSAADLQRLYGMVLAGQKAQMEAQRLKLDIDKWQMLAAQALLDKATSPEVQAIVGSNETNESKLARLRALLFGQRKTVTPEFVDAPSS
nr:MAG TPA: Protein of unknown function (DUF3486) [Caudoviricetes sp.]